MKYIAIPYLMEEDRPGTEKFLKNIEIFRQIGEACNKVGITLLYHNHDFEFVKMPDGRYALDYIYDTIPPTAPDRGGYLLGEGGWRDPPLCEEVHRPLPLVHLKDFHKEGRPANMYQLIGTEVEEQESHGTFEFRPVGHGDQDFGPILEALWKPAPSGLWWSRTSPTDVPPWKPSTSAAST
mgnify:CR=1 FL=1